MGIREHSNQGIVRERLWYFNEETANDFFPIQKEENSVKIDTENKSIKERKEHVINRPMGRSRVKRECSFVVDWQLSDSF